MIDWLIRRTIGGPLTRDKHKHNWVKYTNSRPRVFCSRCSIGRWSWK